MATSEPTKVDIIDVIVLYERSTGLIRHTHYVSFIKGGKKSPTKEENEERAFELAGQRGVRTSELVALHVSGTDLKPNVEFRVDINTKTLVPLRYAYPNQVKTP